ncbi:ribosomal protein S2, flavodoxin-like domain-containing protein [Kalaharituber pfeilii]|nr:ribosomal protein S2, flavodoxin-like domain-containing protein [Kalaharituber pfeilii]
MIIRQALSRKSQLFLGSSPLRAIPSIRCFFCTTSAAQQYDGSYYQYPPPQGQVGAPGSEPGPSPGSSHSPSSSPDSSPLSYAEQIRRDWKQYHQFQNTTADLGTRIDPHYQPSRLVRSPPRPRDITLELLLASQAHLGHATSLWNPANQRYILGVRQGIHIISLEATAAHLRRAAKIVEGVSEKGGLILFVGTRPGQEQVVVNASGRAGGCHLFERWTPGAITNAKQILEQTPHEARKAVKPDLVVCLNPLENYVLLHECGLYAIPTIGIIDTDADPTWVTYPIPANDDSLRAVQLICGILGRAAEEGRTRRIRRAVRESAEREAREAAEAAAEARVQAVKEAMAGDMDLDLVEGWGDDGEGENRSRRERVRSKLRAREGRPK